VTIGPKPKFAPQPVPCILNRARRVADRPAMYCRDCRGLGMCQSCYVVPRGLARAADATAPLFQGVTNAQET
jgi:hypothetical protein